MPGDAANPDLQAYHFVVDAYGTSNRGAESHLTQGFYIVGPTADPDDADPSEPAPNMRRALERAIAFAA